jgi:type VI protein secretion system component VasK
MAAEQSPMPIKGWINQLTNDTWHFLLKNAMHYLDTSWSERVTQHYQNQIAGRYPFNREADDEVQIKKFIHFFGKPGIITSFYSDYLSPLVDTSKPEWKWKKLDGQELPLSSSVIHQIQQAMKIHRAFFPKDDDILSVPFALKQQKLGKDINSIRVNMNSKVIVDKRSSDNTPYQMTWPYNIDGKYSSIELSIAGKGQVEVDYPGTWGWFKLVNQSYQRSRSSKDIILNFSKDKQPAQYLLSSQAKNNPFVALNLHHFILPKQLTTIEA